MTSAVFKGVNALQTAIELYNLFLGGDLERFIRQARETFSSSYNIPSSSKTAVLLDQAFWEDAAYVLATNSLRLALNISQAAGSFLEGKFKDLAQGKRFVWVLYMPTPHPDDKSIPNPDIFLPFPSLRLAGASAILQFGGGGGQNRGRLFGFGTANLKGGRAKGTSNQIFRMDYHDQHGPNKSDYEYFADMGQQYEFHFHIKRV